MTNDSPKLGTAFVAFIAGFQTNQIHSLRGISFYVGLRA